MRARAPGALAALGAAAACLAAGLAAIGAGPAAPACAESSAQGGEALRGRLATCAACHGEDGNSKSAGVPSLAGQPKTFTELQLILFREGVRASDAMAPLVEGMSDDEVSALAAHYADQKPQTSAAARDEALFAKGGELARKLRCGTCHLESFAGREQIPRLAGQREDYLGTALLAFRDGTRTGTDGAMNEVLYGVSDADTRALAHFLAQTSL